MAADMELAELADAAGTNTDSNAPRGARELEAVYDIPVTVSAVLGKATMQVSQLLKLGRGAVVELDRKLGEAIDIYVNNRLVARGEVVMVDDSRLGVTMTEIVKTDRARLAAMRVLIIGSLRANWARPRASRSRGGEARPGGRCRCRAGAAARRCSCRSGAVRRGPRCGRGGARDRGRAYGGAGRRLRHRRRCGGRGAAIRDGAREFLPLPPDPDLIAASSKPPPAKATRWWCDDPAMQATVHRAEQVAASEVSVLITGESGTGKELWRAIFIAARAARAGPFVALNCAAIPKSDGKRDVRPRKGAFSGAAATRVGKFEAAHGGTLLLDEICEMDVRLQAKLLRAFQEREIDRLGGAAAVKVNVRILAITNRDLMAEVQRGDSARTCISG